MTEARELLLRHRTARVASEEADRFNADAEQLIVAPRWEEAAAARRELEALGPRWQDEVLRLATEDPEPDVRDEARRLVPGAPPERPRPAAPPPHVGRDPRQEPRPGDIVRGFDGEQREVVHVWPRALGADLQASAVRGGAPATLRAGALVGALFRDDDGSLKVRLLEAAGPVTYRLALDDEEQVPLVDAPAGTPVADVEYRPLAPGSRQAHMLALQKVRLGLWRGWARGAVIRVGPG